MYYKRVRVDKRVKVDNNETSNRIETSNRMGSSNKIETSNRIGSSKDLLASTRYTTQGEQRRQYSYFERLLSKTVIGEIVELNHIYNRRTVIDNGEIEDESNLLLDRSECYIRRTLQRKSTIRQSDLPLRIREKKTEKTYGNYISRLQWVRGVPRIVCRQINPSGLQTHQLNAQELKGPHSSITQDEVSGRYFIYNNQGRILVYSSELLSNPLRDTPLIAINLNEYPPRYKLLLMLGQVVTHSVHIQQQGEDYSYGHWRLLGHAEGQIIAYEYYKGILNILYIQYIHTLIQVFLLNKRDISLIPLITITMQYPRLSPIVFQIRMKKGLIWQDDVQGEKEKVLIILGGNVLDKQSLQDNIDISDQIIHANSTCEYIEVKQIMDYIDRQEYYISGGISYDRLNITDSLNIKYQNNLRSSINQHLHHGCVLKQEDGLFSDGFSLFLITSTIVLQISSISYRLHEINLVDSLLRAINHSQITQVSTKYVKPLTIPRTIDKNIYYMDDDNVLHEMCAPKPHKRCSIY